jgi:hypothetical protein
MKIKHAVFNVQTARSGGMGQKGALKLLKVWDIEAFPVHSVITGYSAVCVKLTNKRTMSKVHKILYT